jgi:hypothetical protein
MNQYLKHTKTNPIQCREAKSTMDSHWICGKIETKNMRSPAFMGFKTL